MGKAEYKTRLDALYRLVCAMQRQAGHAQWAASQGGVNAGNRATRADAAADDAAAIEKDYRSIAHTDVNGRCLDGDLDALAQAESVFTRWGV